MNNPKPKPEDEFNKPKPDKKSLIKIKIFGIPPRWV